MHRSQPLLAALLLLLAALAVACGGSSGSHATPTPSPYPTAAPRATAPKGATLLVVPSPTRTIPETVFDAPPPSGISTLTFIDPLHGWAIDTCPESKTSNFTNTWCTIISTDDGGVTWRRQYREIHKLGEPQFLDAENGFAIASGDSILATSDGGNTWTPLYADAPHDIGGIRFITPNAGFALASGIIFKLNDARNAWVFNYGSPDCSFSYISSSLTGDVWAGGHGSDGPCLYKTDNLGETWAVSFAGASSPSVAEGLSHSPIFVTRGSPVLQMSQSCSSGAPKFFSDTEARLPIFCQMGDGVTLTSSNAGKTWVFASEQYSCLMSCMTMNYQTGGGGPTFYLDNMHAWQRTAHEVISWSVDGGLTWTEVDSPALCCDAGSIFFVDADHGWVTVGGEIARTTDGGRTWTRLPVTIQ